MFLVATTWAMGNATQEWRPMNQQGKAKFWLPRGEVLSERMDLSWLYGFLGETARSDSKTPALKATDLNLLLASLTTSLADLFWNEKVYH